MAYDFEELEAELEKPKKVVIKPKKKFFRKIWDNRFNILIVLMIIMVSMVITGFIASWIGGLIGPPSVAIGGVMQPYGYVITG